MPKPTTPPGVTVPAQFDLFRTLVEGVTDYAIFILTPEGIVASWNAGAERIKGYRADEIVGRHFSQFYPQEAIDSGWPESELRSARRLGRFEDEGWRKRKDGSLFWANVVITAVRTPEGDLVGFSKITRDLTERRAHEEALRHSEESFRLLIEGVKDHAIYRLDPDGAVVSWNAGAERVIGFKAAEAIGRGFAEFYPHEAISAGTPQRHLDMARTVGFVEDTGWRLRRDGSRFLAYVAVTALRHEDGALRGFAAVTRDISEQHRLVELETEGKRITEFIAMLAHELRNPLAPIRNAIGVMQRESCSPKVEWGREMISRQVDHLTHLVDDLLDVSRITSGKILLEKVPLDLNSLVASAVESVHPSMEASGHQLSFRPSDTPMRLSGDPIRLSQVVVNLLTNAQKYTPSGGEIEVRLERAGGRFYIRVRDNGIGMSEELVARAFDLFVQGERSLDRSEGGLGIGLTLVKRITALHGGTVTALSQGPGRGSEFVVSLPAPENDVPLVHPVKSASQSLAPRRILVVDDNVDAAESLSLLLGMSGHVVRIAHDGGEAIALAVEEPPDLVLLDIGLPGLNGYEVAKRLRVMPALRNTRLLAMTGYGQESDRDAAKEAGFDGYLVKPVDYAELTETIEGMDSGGLLNR